MDGLTCDRCARPLLVGEDCRYILDLKLYAAYDPLEITAQDLAEAGDPERWRQLIEACEGRSAEDLEAEVYKAFRFDLCMRCQRAVLASPLPPRAGEVAPRSLQRRIGVLGGSFDPPHRGHTHLARALAERLALDRVILVPSAQQPLKGGRHGASADARLRMVQAACEGAGAWLEASDLELRRGGTSYTVDTLAELTRQLGPEAELFFLAGADIAETLDQWHRVDEAVALARFVLATRPGYHPRVPARLAERLQLVDIAPLEISSTEVRRRALAGEPLEGLVEPAVIEVIRALGAYGAGG